MKNVLKLPDRYVDNILSLIKEQEFVDGRESAGFVAGEVKQLKIWPGNTSYGNISKSFHDLITDMFRDNVRQISNEGTLQPYNTDIIHGVHVVKYDVGDYDPAWYAQAGQFLTGMLAPLELGTILKNVKLVTLEKK